MSICFFCSLIPRHAELCRVQVITSVVSIIKEQNICLKRIRRRYKATQTSTEMCGTDIYDLENLDGRRSLWPKGRRARFAGRGKIGLGLEFSNI